MLKAALAVMTAVVTMTTLFVLGQGVLAIEKQFGLVVMGFSAMCVVVTFLGIAKLLDKRAPK